MPLQPPINDCQARIYEDWQRLRQLADEFDFELRGRFRDYNNADQPIWWAMSNLAKAMDFAFSSYDEDYGRYNHPRQHDWSAWKPVEEWILKSGTGTNSAARFAASYIIHALGIVAFDHRESYGGTLDTARTAMIEAMLTDDPPLNELPPRFWQVFLPYRKFTEREMKIQGIEV